MPVTTVPVVVSVSFTVASSGIGVTVNVHPPDTNVTGIVSSAVTTLVPDWVM